MSKKRITTVETPSVPKEQEVPFEGGKATPTIKGMILDERREKEAEHKTQKRGQQKPKRENNSKETSMLVSNAEIAALFNAAIAEQQPEVVVAEPEPVAAAPVVEISEPEDPKSALEAELEQAAAEAQESLDVLSHARKLYNAYLNAELAVKARRAEAEKELSVYFSLLKDMDGQIRTLDAAPNSAQAKLVNAFRDKLNAAVEAKVAPALARLEEARAAKNTVVGIINANQNLLNEWNKTHHSSRH